MEKGMRVIITGAGGHVGSNISNFLVSMGLEVHGIGLRKERVDNYNCLSIEDAKGINDIFKKISPDIVIHTAAISSLSECEKNPTPAHIVNVEGTRNVVNAIKNSSKDARMVFMSSDYVFEGSGGNYKENDNAFPNTVYGKTKLECENIIKKELRFYIICRSANIYGRGGNFFNFVSKNLGENRIIDIFSDTYYTPTYIDYFIDCLYRLLERDYTGTIHIAGKEKTTRYLFALKVAEALGKSHSLVRPIHKPHSELIAKDSSLDSSFLRGILNNYCPSIEKSLEHCFGNLDYPF